MIYKKTDELKSKSIIFANLELISEMKTEGKSYEDIASAINISISTLYKYLNYNKYINTSKRLSIEEKSKLDCLNTIGDDLNTEQVKGALYKSCFDRVIDYKDCLVDRSGVEHIINRQLVIPANVSAQRFWLINKRGNEWKNENAQLNLTAGDGSVKSINIAFSDSNDKESQTRIANIESELKSNNSK